MDGVVHKKTPFSSLSPLLSFKAHFFLICFYYCLARGSTSVVELLLDNGSDVLLTDDQSYTSLHLSAAWESAPTVNLLLAAGSDINTLNRKTAADVVSQSAEVYFILLLANTFAFRTLLKRSVGLQCPSFYQFTLKIFFWYFSLIQSSSQMQVYMSTLLFCM